jgi:hypothetical protein
MALQPVTDDLIAKFPAKVKEAVERLRADHPELYVCFPSEGKVGPIIFRRPKNAEAKKVQKQSGKDGWFDTIEEFGLRVTVYPDDGPEGTPKTALYEYSSAIFQQVAGEALLVWSGTESPDTKKL